MTRIQAGDGYEVSLERDGKYHIKTPKGVGYVVDEHLFRCTCKYCQIYHTCKHLVWLADLKAKGEL